MPSRQRSDSSASSPALAEKVQAILDNKKLTLYQVSQQSAKLYGRSSPFFLPHNLYYDLRAGSFRPSIQQMATLSRISGYRIADWLRVFGYNLEDITRLQISLPTKRTVVLDTSLVDPNEWTSPFDSRPNGISIPSITPLAKLLRVTPARRVGSLHGPGPRRFVYAKVGREDALAFPDLVPGSVVRVNSEIVNDTGEGDAAVSNRIFLVEHSKGFCCCRIRTLENGAIVPFDNGFRHAQVELHRPQETKLWGVVDFEFRPLLRMEKPVVPNDLARHWRPQPLPSNEPLGQTLKRTRGKRNLSIREVARMSIEIAELLDDDRYTISPSSLSDYELHNPAPRDFHKIVTLCSIYGLQLESVMRRMGIDLSDTGEEAMPDRYLSRSGPGATKDTDGDMISPGFFEKLREECQEIPLFLRHSFGYFGGTAHVSLDDFFWVGGDDSPLHPYLAEALVVMVNRRRKKPVHFFSKPLWQQPIYVVLKRDGTHLAACCGIEGGTLVVHAYTQDFHRDEQYRLHQDAEVVGQIVAIARRLPQF